MSRYEKARNGTGKNSKHSWRTDTSDGNGLFLYRPKATHQKKSADRKGGYIPNESQSQPRNFPQKSAKSGLSQNSVEVQMILFRRNLPNKK